MKNSKLFISVCMVLVLAFLSACGEDKDIRTAIPSDAQIVVAADWNALAKKGVCQTLKYQHQSMSLS